MGRLWRRELWRLTALVMIGALIGWPFSLVAWGIIVGLALTLAHHLRQLHALHQWLRFRPQQEPPTSTGIWGALFDRLYRYQKGQRITQQRLRSILQRIQESSEAMRDSVVMLDRHGDMEWWNSAAERMLGLKSTLDRGQHITNLMRDPRFVGYFNGRDYREPLTLSSPIDENMMLQFQITLYGDDERLVMARDITRLHRLEQMRQDFVANVSHELRTPLTVLIGYLETYSDLTEMLPTRLARGIEQMQGQTRRMQSLVNDLLWLSRLEHDQAGRDHMHLDPHSLLQVVQRDARALSNNRQQIEIHIEAPHGLWGSEQEVLSALSNLAFNAVRYAGDGASIQLRWRACKDGACFEVEDDGEGIDPRHIPRLTERFYRIDKGRSTTTGGTGLGLAIVKHVLLRHNAYLDISSRPGEGAIFRCVFPPHRLVDAVADQRLRREA